MSVSKIAKMQNLKNEQVRYVLKHKRPSQIFDYHHEDTSPIVVDEYTVDSQDLYTVDSKGDAKIDTPEGNLDQKMLYSRQMVHIRLSGIKSSFFMIKAKNVSIVTRLYHSEWVGEI